MSGFSDKRTVPLSYDGYVVHEICEINSDGTISPRMYEREGSAFDVDIKDVAGVYKAAEGTVTIENDGTFEASVGEDNCKGTVIFDKTNSLLKLQNQKNIKVKIMVCMFQVLFL